MSSFISAGLFLVTEPLSCSKLCEIFVITTKG